MREILPKIKNPSDSWIRFFDGDSLELVCDTSGRQIEYRAVVIRQGIRAEFKVVSNGIIYQRQAFVGSTLLPVHQGTVLELKEMDFFEPETEDFGLEPKPVLDIES